MDRLAYLQKIEAAFEVTPIVARSGLKLFLSGDYLSWK